MLIIFVIFVIAVITLSCSLKLNLDTDYWHLHQLVSVVLTLYFTILFNTNYFFSWKVYLGKNSTVYINNTSENKLLVHYELDTVELCNKYHVKNLWKIGTVDNNGYFNLTHLDSKKLLTATSSPSNTLKVYKSM